MQPQAHPAGPRARSWHAMALAAVATIWAGQAVGQGAAEPPAVKVGDHWKYEQSDKRTGVKQQVLDRVVTAVSATQIEGTENDGKYVMTPELNALETSTSVWSGTSRGLSFPLEVGKKWDYKTSVSSKRSAYKGRWELEATVAAIEKVTVPAGEFEAYRIDYTGFWNDDQSNRRVKNGRLKITSWYAPAARALVKTEFEDGNDDWVRVLVELQLQP